MVYVSLENKLNLLFTLKFAPFKRLQKIQSIKLSANILQTKTNYVELV